MNKWLFSVATAAFLMVALLTLQDDLFAHQAFRIALAFYSLTMIAVEISEGLSDLKEGLISQANRILAIVGYIIFIQAAYLYQSFNKGDIYMLGSFFISLAFMLRLLKQIIKSTLSLKLFWKHPYHFMRLISLAGVGFFFFVTSAAEGLQDQHFFSILLLTSKTGNILAAVLHVVAVYNMFKEQSLKKIQKIKFEDSNGNITQ